MCKCTGPILPDPLYLIEPEYGTSYGYFLASLQPGRSSSIRDRSPQSTPVSNTGNPFPAIRGSGYFGFLALGLLVSSNAIGLPLASPITFYSFCPGWDNRSLLRELATKADLELLIPTKADFEAFTNHIKSTLKRFHRGQTRNIHLPL